MRKFSIAVALVGALFALALAGCSGGGLGSQAADKDTLKGFWELDSDSGIGLSAYVYLMDDDTAEFVVGDSLYECTWAIADGKAELVIDGGQTGELTYTGEKLVLGKEDGSRLVFAKDDSDSREGGDGTGGSSSTANAEGDSESGEGGADEPEAVEGSGDEVIETDNVEIVDEVIEEISPVVIADDGTCMIAVTGKGTDFTADPCYRVSFTNKTDEPLYITAEEAFTVSGKEIVPGLGDVAEPGKTVEAIMYFPKEELGGGLDLLVDVTGTINIEVDEAYEPVADYSFHME